MNWRKAARFILFLAGMLTAGGAAQLFYHGFIAPGMAYFAMTALFLWFGMRQPSETDAAEEEPERSPGIIDDAALNEMALLVADLAVASLRGVGRTVPPSTKEIEQLEERTNSMLDHMGVPSDHRGELKEEFNRLKGRMRRSEGGIALIRSRRL
ncbi:MAG: hypothetical protein K6E38_02190 [Fretibacterium sp.]|nr:hypothetical protein [Fretibacterium sp.]